METGYLSKTKMSEFDRFLPHLKKINHRYPNFDLCIRLLAPVANAHFIGEFWHCGNQGQRPAGWE
jgi:hypothetical protein